MYNDNVEVIESSKEYINNIDFSFRQNFRYIIHQKDSDLIEENKINNERICNMSVQDMIRYIKQGSTYLKDQVIDIYDGYSSNCFNLQLDVNKLLDLTHADIREGQCYYVVEPDFENNTLSTVRKNIKTVSTTFILPKIFKEFKYYNYSNNEDVVNYVQNTIHLNKDIIINHIDTKNIKSIKNLEINIEIGCSNKYYIRLLINGFTY